MMPDINAEKSAEGSVLTAGQKLLLKRILVELLSGVQNQSRTRGCILRLDR